MFTGRNPRLEVLEAGLAVMTHADAGFATEMLGLHEEGKLERPHVLLEQLQERLRKKGHDIPDEVEELSGFRTANTIYDERLMAEWLEFLKAMQICENTNQEFVLTGLSGHFT